MTDKPSGSFVLWENTLCNPLSDSRSMAHSAWHDGYASGVKAEREACAQIAKQWDKDHPRTNYGGCIALIIEGRK